MGQGREDLTDGQEKSLTENLTCCCIGWQGWGGRAENKEAAGNLGIKRLLIAESLCPTRWGGYLPLIALLFRQVLKHKMQNTDTLGIKTVTSVWIGGG